VALPWSSGSAGGFDIRKSGVTAIRAVATTTGTTGFALEGNKVGIIEILMREAAVTSSSRDGPESTRVLSIRRIDIRAAVRRRLPSTPTATDDNRGRGVLGDSVTIGGQEAASPTTTGRLAETAKG
jgi:hypothetical protein